MARALFGYVDTPTNSRLLEVELAELRGRVRELEAELAELRGETAAREALERQMALLEVHASVLA